MTSFWTLTKGYDGSTFDDTDDLNPSRAYQFRHGDYFERISIPSVSGDKYMYTRMTDNPEVNEFLRDIQLTLPEDMVWNIVDKNYKVDVLAEANIDSRILWKLRTFDIDMNLARTGQPSPNHGRLKMLT